MTLIHFVALAVIAWFWLGLAICILTSETVSPMQPDEARDAATKEFWHRKVPRFLLALTLAVMVGGLSANRGLARDGCEPIYIMRTRKKAA